jgi:hypothetical protein
MTAKKSLVRFILTVGLLRGAAAFSHNAPTHALADPNVTLMLGNK